MFAVRQGFGSAEKPALGFGGRYSRICTSQPARHRLQLRQRGFRVPPALLRSHRFCVRLRQPGRAHHAELLTFLFGRGTAPFQPSSPEAVFPAERSSVAALIC
jgi:hypothetical protein